MKLIIDGGSTKTAWALCRPGSSPKIFMSRGCNALSAEATQIEELARQVVVHNKIAVERVKAIDFYGAGCATMQVCDKVRQALSTVFSNAVIHVASDLEAAAKALFPDSDGIACILGTGSNSCLWRGASIVSNIPPLGYILGDEGSGTALGKRLIADSLRGIIDPALVNELRRDFSIDMSHVLENVYRNPSANTYLASIVPFMAINRSHPDIHNILVDEFTSFIERNVALYADSHSYPLAFCGSIALHFKEELAQVAGTAGYKISKIIPGPIETLARIDNMLDNNLS